MTTATLPTCADCNAPFDLDWSATDCPVCGGMSCENSKSVELCAICEDAPGVVDALWDEREVKVCCPCFKYETGS